MRPSIGNRDFRADQSCFPYIRHKEAVRRDIYIVALIAFFLWLIGVHAVSFIAPPC